MSLAQAGIRGAYFTSLALGFRQVVSLLTTIYIARQLLPSDLGVFAMVMIVIGFAQVIGDVGIAAGLVRSQKNDTVLLSTCFWVCVGIGLVLSMVVYLCAPLATAYYEKPAVQPLLQVSAIGLLFSFLSPVPMALLQQRLAYREIAFSQALSSLAGAMAAAVLVYGGYGIWGLVFQPMVGNLLAFCAMAYFSKWRPTLQFNLAKAKDIIKNGFYLLGAGLTTYLRNNFDTLVIGRALDARDLGLYSMAQTILYAPMHLITSTVNRVTFPLFAKVQNDLEKIKTGVLTVTSRTALLIYPLYFGLIVVAEEFVFQVFGLQWMNMVFLIRVMAISFLIQSTGGIAGSLLLALGKTRAMLFFSIGGSVIYFVVLLMLIPYGLSAVAVGYAATNATLGLAYVGMALYFAKIPVLEYLQAFYRPLVLALAMCGVVLAVKFTYLAQTKLQFATLIVAGAITYALLVFVFEKTAWRQVRDALVKKKQ